VGITGLSKHTPIAGKRLCAGAGPKTASQELARLAVDLSALVTRFKLA
jgi:hypothetical protein